jgi:hypothetical protein
MIRNRSQAKSFRVVRERKRVDDWCVPRSSKSSQPSRLNTHETPSKQAPITSADGCGDPSKDDGSARSVTLENKGRTIWDETLAALTRALDKAVTGEERLAILAELRAWRGVHA